MSEKFTKNATKVAITLATVGMSIIITPNRSIKTGSFVSKPPILEMYCLMYTFKRLSDLRSKTNALLRVKFVDTPNDQLKNAATQ